MCGIYRSTYAREFPQLNNFIFSFKDEGCCCADVLSMAVLIMLIFEDLIERAKEKEEKEAKKRQRLAKDFTEKLSTIKEITDSL
ncbi:hypothetical protein HAX54_040382 [Datura stramonium]|uniref:Uncharacterized protein n=1 Tax=Datura stramonium TaxID=4076 RepID=A0ABS8VRH2_DATST|nr:hypothetical protein [Datura stramonium]